MRKKVSFDRAIQKISLGISAILLFGYGIPTAISYGNTLASMEVMASDMEEEKLPKEDEQKEISILKAVITEIEGSSMLVTPVDGSWELRSTDSIRISMQDMPDSSAAQVGDLVRIKYNGEILETDPASLGEIYDISLISEFDGSGLYIFTGGDDYMYYPLEEECTPEELLAGIEELTGWKLSLADEITSGKGGMTVSFAKDSCLFVGPPEEQKEEFYVHDAYQLSFAVLDSVQKTLQCWASPINPDSVDIYFCMEGDIPLELESLGITLPMDQPYSHDALKALLEQES